jgi:RNA polymerase sigma-70 factor (ECF subfamily)
MTFPPSRPSVLLRRCENLAVFPGFLSFFVDGILALNISGFGTGWKGVEALPEAILMVQDHPSRTSVTLLGRLHHDATDQAAWSDFVARYGPRILQWCRRWRLQEADAQDVAQDVLLKLHKLMATFSYDPAGSFRAWLKTLAHHAWHDLVAERRRAGIGTGDTPMAAFLNNLTAGGDLAGDLQEEFRRELLDLAMARVKARVPSQTWDAFRLTALEGCSGAEAAAELQMRTAQVYLARSKVKKRIQEEVQRLEGGQ